MIRRRGAASVGRVATTIMADIQSTEAGARAAVDRTGTIRGGGSIGLVLLIAIVLVGAAVALMFIGRANAQPYILALLAVLATVGVFLMFALAAGILRPAGRDGGSPLVKAVVDAAPEGTLVTDARGRVIYANAAYLELVGATDAKDVRPVERAFIGDPGVSEAVYRLLTAAREGRRLQEEVRIGAHRGEAGRWLRMRVRPLGAAKREVAHDGLVARRRDARTRAPRERLSGTAARHRLSRPCAGRFLLGGGQRQHRLSQRHARQLARPRSGAILRRRPEARRHRRGRGRGAAHHAGCGARRSAHRSVRHRSQDPRRAHRSGAAVPQGGVRRRRRAGPFAHAGHQPLARRRHRSAARRRSALHALLPQYADGDRHRRPRRPDRAVEPALRPPVPSGAQGRRRRPRRPLDPRRRGRTRPRRARSGDPPRGLGAERDRAGRSRARRLGERFATVLS